MPTYREFLFYVLFYVKENILQYMPPSYRDHKVKLIQNVKDNDQKMEGITIQEGKKTVEMCPAVYLETYYVQFLSGRDIDDVMHGIAAEYLQAVQFQERLPRQRHQKNLLTRKKDVCREMLFILTNEERSLGATAILLPDMAEQIHKRIGDDYYILPVSLDEVLIAPKRFSTTPKKLGTMLREANQSIPREVILSDCVYEFTRENPQIRCVPESMLQKEKSGLYISNQGRSPKSARWKIPWRHVRKRWEAGSKCFSPLTTALPSSATKREKLTEWS